MLEYCCSRSFFMDTLVFIIVIYSRVADKDFQVGKVPKTIKCEKKRAYTTLIRSHQNDIFNLSPV